MSSRELIQRLVADGWVKQKARAGTSHVFFKHPTKSGKVCVPHPKKDLKVGTLSSIARQAQIDLK